MRTVAHLLILPFVALAAHAMAISFDFPLWFPFETDTEGLEKDPGEVMSSFIVRNECYFSVKLESVYIYYKSGYLENIRDYVVATRVTFRMPGRDPIERGSIVTTWHKADKRSPGEFVGGAKEHLVLYAPATPSAVGLAAQLRGFGKHKFKKVFDMFTRPELKTALSLSEPTVAAITGIGSLVKQLLAPPWTSDNPKNMLDVSHTYRLLGTRQSLSGVRARGDVLRDGYLALISSRGKKRGDRLSLTKLYPDRLRINQPGSTLQRQTSNGEWEDVNDFSYVVFSITQSSARGVDTDSPWHRKYAAALACVDKHWRSYTPVKAVEKEAYALWREGNVLLDSEPNYIEREREQIKSLAADAIRRKLHAYVMAASEDAMEEQSPGKDGHREGAYPGLTYEVDATALGIDPDFRETAKAYLASLQDQYGHLSLTVVDANGQPLSETDIVLKRSVLGEVELPGRELITDEKGTIPILKLQPGEYTLETTGGEEIATRFVLDPTDTGSLTVAVPTQDE